MWRNLKFCQIWRNFKILHMTDVKKSEIYPVFGCEICFVAIYAIFCVVCFFAIYALLCGKNCIGGEKMTNMRYAHIPWTSIFITVWWNILKLDSRKKCYLLTLFKCCDHCLVHFLSSTICYWSSVHLWQEIGKGLWILWNLQERAKELAEFQTSFCISFDLICSLK